jgi:N-acetylglucosamine kinase-like BadF-type ATPase
MSGHSTLALDAGQTGIRTLLISVGSKVSGSYPGLRTDTDLFPQLASVIVDALAQHDGPMTLSVGMTGLTAANSKPAELLSLLPAQVDRVFLAHDSVTGFLGSIGLGRGVMTAVGTGVVTLGVGTSAIARVDGWGNLIGDAGSAYWIGRAGLEAGMRAYDGRLDSPAMLSLVTDNFSHPEEAYIDLQTSSDRVARIASFARAVSDLAEHDDVAAEIMRSAGRELAVSAIAAARRVGLLAVTEGGGDADGDTDTDERGPRFSWTGNVMKSDLLRETFMAEVSAAVPTAVLAPPVAEPVDGVALLEHVPDDSPLQAAIHEAQR